MAYKDIVVQLDSAASHIRYEVAADLAVRSSGHVTGVYPKTTLINQYNNIDAICYLPPNELDRMVREHNQGQDDDAAKAAAVLACRSQASQVQCDWRKIGGDTPDDLIAEARCADLVVLPPPSASPAYNVHASAVDIAISGGGPVLITPEKIGRIRIGARILLAWNGSREAARALRDALPLFVEGAFVEIRTAHPKLGEPDAAGSVRYHLERLGYKTNVDVMEDDDDQSIGAWLKREAAETDCDLIVMGVYGHTRLREFILGGVSREMLHAPSLPTLISH
jgi:nucleotide-binding universal stress UspA family protein